MQIGTIRAADGTTAVRVEGDDVVVLDFDDVGAVLRADALDTVSTAAGESMPLASVDWAPLITLPNKIVCVGLNYHDHVRETGSELPAAPTYFSKFSGSLVGARDTIELPSAAVSTAVDWEVELCIVIGREARHVSEHLALDHVAGYTILNDVSVRDWQKRTTQFLAGKTFERTTPVGPAMTTTDELGDGSGLAVKTEVDGVVKQDSSTDELIFGTRRLIADLSTIITLLPGDLIATGTPGGVGASRTPPEFLVDGSELVTTIDGIGELRNRCARPA